MDVNFEFKPDFNENCRNRKTEVPDIGKISIGEFYDKKKEKEDFTKILSHSQEGINEMVQSPQNFLYIDAKMIVDDWNLWKRERTKWLNKIQFFG